MLATSDRLLIGQQRSWHIFCSTIQ